MPPLLYRVAPCSGAWVGDLNGVLASGTGGAAAAAAKVTAGLAALQSASSLDGAKASYVSAVSALEEWAALTGVAGKLKGL